MFVRLAKRFTKLRNCITDPDTLDKWRQDYAILANTYSKVQAERNDLRARLKNIVEIAARTETVSDDSPASVYLLRVVRQIGALAANVGADHD